MIIKPQTIQDLKNALAVSPGGFLIVEEGAPRFAVLEYSTFQKLKGEKLPEKKTEKILVTGGAGYIGAHAVRLLVRAGYEVIVYDNLSTGRREAVKDAELVVADLSDRMALNKVFSENKIDAVIHFAASTSVEESVQNPAKYFQNNVVNGLNLLDAMVEHGVGKIVFSSTAAVYGEPDKVSVTEDMPVNPTNPYGETKHAFEQILKWYAEGYGLASISLRYFNAAGAWLEEDLGYNNFETASHLIPRVLDVACGKKAEVEIYGIDYPTPDGTGIRDYIHVRDLAEAHILALAGLASQKGAQVYNLGTGRGCSVLEVVDTTVEITGKMIPIKQSPRRAGDPARIVADSGKFQNTFGWIPKHDLNSMLSSAWQWHRDRA